ncbi:HDOD domain-containing protein [Azoarcus indigens]|uniref:HD-like signal output (HDOD) protein n=1 Tax=Azoarcus indigens TaxID=29545 RepID=A0A4R6EGT6_9RHOO|nr:HDOD domain-containing protein [Azoarcus indigens]NMG63471.1 HDOD domain-containing protein [Azoarcus indigens]TDN57023.1 HD-like signal output (HDOD) protein [Azoarcus indigens]
MHSAQELVSHVEALASLPTVYQRIREQLDSPDGSVLEVARLVSADPALTVRLLRLVNSALYGYGGQVDTVNRAVQILGLQQVHDLVLAMSVSAVFSGIQPERMEMGRFWRGSVMCALAARTIAQGCGLPSAERLFVIGLLADLGHLVMYQTVPALAAEAQDCADRGEEALHMAEQRIVGCDYAEVGATLMDHWRLPPFFAEVVGAQIVPRLGGDHSFDAAILHVASALVQADRRGEASSAAAERIAPSVWSQLNMSPESLSRIREEAELNLAAYVSLFFPSLKMR